MKSTIDRMVLLFDGPILRAPWWDMPEQRPTKTVAPSPAPALHAAPALPEDDARSVPAAPLNFGSSLPNTKQKLALARKLLAESDDNYSWVAGQLGVNTSTLWRWRKAGKLD